LPRHQVKKEKPSFGDGLLVIVIEIAGLV